MHVNVFFVVSCSYSAVGLTLVREQRFIELSILLLYYHYHKTPTRWWLSSKSVIWRWLTPQSGARCLRPAKWSSGLMKKQHLVRQSDKSTNITVACCSASIIFSGCCLLMCVSDCLHARWRTLFLCPLSNLLSCWSMLSIVVKYTLFLVSVNVTGFHKCLHYFAFIAWAFCVCFSFLVCFCLFRWQFVEWVSLMKNCQGLYVFVCCFFRVFF